MMASSMVMIIVIMIAMLHMMQVDAVYPTRNITVVGSTSVGTAADVILRAIVTNINSPALHDQFLPPGIYLQSSNIVGDSQLAEFKAIAGSDNHTVTCNTAVNDDVRRMPIVLLVHLICFY
jgi:hypothetical protein